MRLSIRLSALATLAIAGLASATIPAAAAATPHGRAVASGPHQMAARPPATAAETAPLWTARFKPAHWHTEGVATAVSPDGPAVFAIGDGSGTTGGHRFIGTGLTLAYNADTGARLWAARYVPSRGSASLSALAVSPGGSTVFVTGDIYVGGSPGTYHFLTIAYNATTGAQLWADSTGTLGRPASVAVSPDGSTVFVTGFYGHVGDPTTVAYNATTGATVWTQNAGITISGVSVAVARDGSAVFVTGFGQGADTAAYNAATGATLWTAPAAIRPMGLAVSPDGSTVVITGHEKAKTTGTQAYNAATGATLWTVHTNFHPSAVAASPDSSTVFVTGYVKGRKNVGGQFISTEYFGTRAYNLTTGAMLWASRHTFRSASPAGGQAESIAVSPDGAKVFVTGAAPGPGAGTPGGYGTVAYDTSTGAVLWAARYHGSFSGAAHSVAVSLDGTKVFVTGELTSLGPPSGQTMVTLAYNS